MNILLIVDNLAYRLTAKGELELAPLFGVQTDLWIPVPAVGLRTPRQMAMLALIKESLNTAETSQM